MSALRPRSFRPLRHGRTLGLRGCGSWPRRSRLAVPPKAAADWPFRIGTTGASWQDDPALAYLTTSWQLEYATCAKLINYPDAQAPEGSRLRPEIAAAMPTISQDGLTYTFQIRNDFAFSPPASGVVTAQSMKYTFERTLSHDMASPAAQFFANIVGEVAYNDGQAAEITGIVAQGDTLTIHLIQPQGEFLTLLAMPFTCAVPTTLPPVEQFAPIPSAGPYYISAYAINQHITRTSKSELPRVAAAAIRLARVRLQPERDRSAQPGHRRGPRLRPWRPSRRHHRSVRPGQPGSSSRAPAVVPLPCELRRLHAAEHGASSLCEPEHAQGGELRGRPHCLRGRWPAATLRHPSISTSRRACPATRTSTSIPAHPDLERARDLAGWHPGDPLRPITVYYRTQRCGQSGAVRGRPPEPRGRSASR